MDEAVRRDVRDRVDLHAGAFPRDECSACPAAVKRYAGGRHSSRYPCRCSSFDEDLLMDVPTDRAARLNPATQSDEEGCCARRRTR